LSPNITESFESHEFDMFLCYDDTSCRVVKQMRIQLTNYSQPEDDPDIIIHGSKPKMPEKSCGNCAKKNNCTILMSAIRSLSILMPMPVKPSSIIRNSAGQIVPQQEQAMFPLPMPCRGDIWAPTRSNEIEKNPLVQRLGLSNVSEPVSYENMRLKDENPT